MMLHEFYDANDNQLEKIDNLLRLGIIGWVYINNNELYYKYVNKKLHRSSSGSPIFKDLSFNTSLMTMREHMNVISGKLFVGDKLDTRYNRLKYNKFIGDSVNNYINFAVEGEI
jgi:hypothetical protein